MKTFDFRHIYGQCGWLWSCQIAVRRSPISDLQLQISFHGFWNLNSHTIFSSFSAIRVVSSEYLRLLIFILAILIPACASSIKSILSDRSNNTPACFISFCTGYLLSVPSSSLYVFLGLGRVSCRQHIYRSCFCINSVSLYILVGAFSPFTFKVIIKGSGTPLQYSLLKNPMDRGAW